MDKQAQIDFILDHYEHPRHRGVLKNPSLAQSGMNPGCGDVVTLYLKLDADGRIEDVSFEGQGCTISQAGASLLTELVIGKTLDEAGALDGDALAEHLGSDIVHNRTQCATLALNTLGVARDKWQAHVQNGQVGADTALTDVENIVQF